MLQGSTSKFSTVQSFTDQFKQTHSISSEESYTDKLTQWMYCHPAAVKTAEKIGGAVGVGLMALAPTLAFGPAVWAVLVGGGCTAVSYAAHKALDIIVPPHHDMKEHAFKPCEMEGAKLYYKGDIPILELDYSDPRKAGYSQGYMLGSHFNEMLSKLDLAKWMGELPDAKNVNRTLAEIKEKMLQEPLATAYVEEMEGLVAGFNDWSKEINGSKGREITFNDILIFHIMPDSLHFSPEAYEIGLINSQTEEVNEDEIEELEANEAEPLVACTVVMDKDPEIGVVVGRNMDWPTAGIFGTNTLMVHRKHPNEKHSTIEVGFPGFIGTLTGMNFQSKQALEEQQAKTPSTFEIFRNYFREDETPSLALSMNVASGDTKEINGMPAAIFNRMCLENCPNVSKAEELVNEKPPMGPYHLSLADSTSKARAKSIHLFQGDKKQHIAREWSNNTPLVTTNCNYTGKKKMTDHMHYSEERHEIIGQYFTEAKQNISKEGLNRTELVKGSLELPYVDNSLTAHKVIMLPGQKKIQVAFDNAFAGGAKLHELDITDLQK